MYWHSEAFKNKSYHYEKYKKCKEQGIRLITIFEHEWLENKELIKNKLLYIFNKSKSERIYARKCKIQKISKEQKKNFLNKYHIQKNGPSSINYGLYYNDKLVAVLSFIKNNDGSYNLNRYASSCSVIGGFSKLLKHFEKEYNNPKIITFADLRWSEGELYYKTGFKLDGIIPIDYYWMKGNKIYHKFNFRHKGMKNKLEKYNPNLSEMENMHNHGFLKIYDCGKLRFIKNNDK